MDLAALCDLLWQFVLLNVRLVLVALLDLYGMVVPEQQKSLRDQIVLVTGAGGSLGREMAVQLAGMGTHLVLCDVDEVGLQESGRHVQAVGGEVTLYKCDITKIDNVNEMARKVRKEVGEPSIVIHSAGVYHHKPLLHHTDQDIHSTIAVNLLGTIWVTRAFLSAMVGSNSGHVVFLSSVLGVMGRPQLAPYCASKFAITGFCDALSEELHEQGIDGVTLTVVHPFLIGNIQDVSVNMRVPGLFTVLPPEEAVSTILEGVRRNQQEIFVPARLKPLMRINRCLPRKMRRVCQDFMENKSD